MIHVILTSYNRPVFLQRAIDSLLKQTYQDWHCYLMDDNSDKRTLKVLDNITDARFTVKHHKTDESEREESRYAILINEILPKLTDGIVCYLTDNTEYYPDTFATVARFFDENPDKFMGYVWQLRDVRNHVGELLGTAGQFGHWDYIPQYRIDFSDIQMGNLDHSQVFHRLPITATWHTHTAFRAAGDYWFYRDLQREHGPIYKISDKVLAWEHIIR